MQRMQPENAARRWLFINQEESLNQGLISADILLLNFLPPELRKKVLFKPPSF